MRIFLAFVILGVAATAAVAQVDLTSGPKQVPLIELFTSEGCSSCPPAEAWLSQLQDNPALWKTFVPVAFHVDYWDHLGWKDPFATPSFSARQWAYGRVWDATIYTPEIIVGGNEWKEWHGAQQPRAVPSKDVGTLTVSQTRSGKIEITFDGKSDPEATLIARVALLGFDQSSSVKQGENEGQSLNHDFIALRYTSAKLKPTDGGKLEATVKQFKVPKNENRLAIAVWVERRGDPRPIQATGGWLKTELNREESNSLPEQTSTTPR